MQARVKNKTGSLVSQEYSLDRLGTKPVLRLPTARSPGGSSDNLTQGSVPTELQEKVASLLASESSRKVRPPLRCLIPMCIRHSACKRLPYVLMCSACDISWGADAMQARAFKVRLCILHTTVRHCLHWAHWQLQDHN